MSLINDALKKAQKQRTGEAPVLASMPSVGGESATRIARRSKSGAPGSMLIWAGAAVGLLLLVGGYFAFRTSPTANGGDAKPAPVAQSSSPAAKRPDEPAVVLAKAGAPASSEKSAPVTFVLPTAPAPLPTDAKHLPDGGQDKSRAGSSPQRETAGQTPGQLQVATGPASSPAAKPPVSQPSTVNPQPAVAAPPPKLDPRAIQYIDNIKVAGIRASATDAKVLMNDRVYRIGSQVDADLGLKLVGITANSLTFEDERGARYTRTL